MTQGKRPFALSHVYIALDCVDAAGATDGTVSLLEVTGFARALIRTIMHCMLLPTLYPTYEIGHIAPQN